MTEKTHYELLDIVPGATESEIEEAFEEAKAVYGEDSVALYSLYSSQERDARLKQIVEAYETLKDPEKRDEYDTALSALHEEEPRKEGSNGEGQIGGLSIVDVIGEAGEREHRAILKKGLVVMDDRDPIVAEQYRILYTKLEEISYKNSFKSFAVTSAIKGEGKTSTVMNLSYLMAQEFKKKVVVVECDFKNPSITFDFLETGSSYGLVDLVRGEVEVEEAISRIGDSNLYFLPAMRKVRSSSELLSSPRLNAILNTLKADFDYVIIDCPPILPLADMGIISRVVDGTVLVVMAGRTPQDTVLKAAKSLPNGTLMGIVLNGTDASLKKHYY